LSFILKRSSLFENKPFRLAFLAREIRTFYEAVSISGCMDSKLTFTQKYVLKMQMLRLTLCLDFQIILA